MFGSFSIDADSRLLFQNGERLSLPPKAADVLIALLEREGQLVTKDELLKQVWPDTFVEEGNLARQIFMLRQMLGDSHPNATYIETVPKRGYRFASPVKSSPSSAVILTAEEHTREHIIIEETEAPDPPGWNIRSTPIAIAAGLLIGTLVLGGIVLPRIRSPARVRSLLVLPFANLSTGGDADYYSDGLTAELIGALSQVRELGVVPRTTAFQFKGKSGDVREIGRQLEADAVLDGSVQRDSDRLRIQLSLTRVSDGHTIWSQTYDRTTADALATQEEIARSVLQAVFPKKDRLDIPPTGTRNPEAHNLYLKGQYLRQKFAWVSPADALALFKQATDLDSRYAEAWAGQAACYTQLGSSYQSYPKDVFPLGMQALNRALALNPRLAYMYIVRGSISLRFFRDWEAAKHDLDKGIELEPREAEGHHWSSHYWVSAGRIDLALEEGRRALRLDPLNFSIGAHQVWVELMRPDYAAATRAAEPTLRLDPENGRTLLYLLRSYEDSGQLQDAIQIRRRLRLQASAIPDLERALSTEGAKGYWRVVAEGLEARRRKGPASPTDLARAYERLGDRTQALLWLEQALEERDSWTIYLKVDPAFASLRSEPRFRQIVQAAGIP